MSVWKGSNLIAMSVPGQNGINGTDGRNGDGIMIVPNYTELHNNINADGHIEMTNKVVPADGELEAHATSCEVGGFDNEIIGTGQATMVWGYGNRVSDGQCGVVLGYGNNVDGYGQGVSVNGFRNIATDCHPGTHIEGYDNIINVADPGVHVEGCKHNFSPTGDGDTELHLSAGGHLGGYGLTHIDDNFIKTRVISGEGTYIEAIGIKVGAEGDTGRLMRNDGCMGIAGDLTFTAVDDHDHVIGRYTLGEIVQALITARILPDPNASNT